MFKEKITIRGARVHNLKNIDVEIPRDQFVVITGLSGSGKSSLAFDTLYAEGQRRYVESLSAYARQFLGLMEKPDVDSIEGLSPAISIDQRKASKNPRSTVATVTEIYDYLRVLFARIGKPYCYRCGKEIASQTPQKVTDTLLDLPQGTKIQILSPLIRGKKGEHKDVFERAKRKGYVRVRVKTERAQPKFYDLDNPPTLERYKKHSIEVVVDRLVVKSEIRSRLADSVETALREGEGMMIAEADGRIGDLQSKKDLLFSEHFACLDCGISYEEISPRIFSFNSPYGACPECKGLGTQMNLEPEFLIVNPELSILEGAIGPWGEPSYHLTEKLEDLAQEYRFDLEAPYESLPKKVREVLLYGSRSSSDFEGVIPYLSRRYHETSSDWTRVEIERYMTIQPCPECKGSRLKKESLAVKIAKRSIHDVVQMTVKDAKVYFRKLKLTKREELIAAKVIKEVGARLRFLVNVGLDYLTLDRITETLSSGEEQRVRLATQIGSGLVGVTYILDEPSIGLHARDNRRLLDTLLNLRDLGNTVVVVEHDKETILSADHVIDLGPGAGEKGGTVVATGRPSFISRNGKSLTGRYLSGRERIEVPKKRRQPTEVFLTILKAEANNLKKIDVKIPLGLFVCITGVSGSGKSTLMNDILYRGLMRHFHHSRHPVGKHRAIQGLEHIDKVINIDQSPIGRTPRSNPATYTGLFTPIRDLFAQLPLSKVRGYRTGRFSFNVKGGRCEACWGDGIVRIEMHFLPDVYVPCEVCKGKRFNRETLEITYKEKSISDVLEMTVTEALNHFDKIPLIKRKLQLLYDVGLGYVHLGQPAPTLSGGEAQRVKLAKELSKVSTGRTLYILDEPTTGLHFEDVKMLLRVLDRLVEKGNTVLIIEHNLDVIKSTDYLIDLGPEGGDEGGEIVVTGTPEHVAKHRSSYTGKFLRKDLSARR
ncbi:excinuclease ABC subunit UvrA [candidate division TA06 bacterium]|nr:excinuclease ABC subunit UvrA [candidate division TA06 bacterium]